MGMILNTPIFLQRKSSSEKPQTKIWATSWVAHAGLKRTSEKQNVRFGDIAESLEIQTFWDWDTAHIIILFLLSHRNASTWLHYNVNHSRII